MKLELHLHSGSTHSGFRARLRSLPNAHSNSRKVAEAALSTAEANNVGKSFRSAEPVRRQCSDARFELEGGLGPQRRCAEFKNVATAGPAAFITESPPRGGHVLACPPLPPQNCRSPIC